MPTYKLQQSTIFHYPHLIWSPGHRPNCCGESTNPPIHHPFSFGAGFGSHRPSTSEGIPHPRNFLLPGFPVCSSPASTFSLHPANSFLIGSFFGVPFLVLRTGSGCIRFNSPCPCIIPFCFCFLPRPFSHPFHPLLLPPPPAFHSCWGSTQAVIR